MKRTVKPLRRALGVSWLLILAGAALALIGAVLYRAGVSGTGMALVWAALAAVLAGVVFHLVKVRCPACGHSLAGYRPLPDTCPQCGQPLREEEKNP